MENIYDELIENIKRKKIEIGNSNKEPIPSIYYIGMAKTASASLMVSFPDNTVAHWHNTKYFEDLYKTRSLSKNGKDILDLIIYIGKKNRFIPLVIECIREPISNQISMMMQHLRKDRSYCNCNLCLWKRNGSVKNELLLQIIKDNIDIQKWIDNIMAIQIWKKHFNIEPEKDFKDYFFFKNKIIKLLLIRYEDIDERSKIFEKLKYKYVQKDKNIIENNLYIKDIYDYVKRKITFSEEFLDQIYNNEVFCSFYSDDDKEKFKNKFLYKPQEIEKEVKDEIDWRGKEDIYEYVKKMENNNYIDLSSDEEEVPVEKEKDRIINPFQRLSSNINSPDYKYFIRKGSFSFSHLQYINR